MGQGQAPIGARIRDWRIRRTGRGSEAFWALLVGVYESKRLKFTGIVGTSFCEKLLRRSTSSYGLNCSSMFTASSLTALAIGLPGKPPRPCAMLYTEDAVLSGPHGRFNGRRAVEKSSWGISFRVLARQLPRHNGRSGNFRPQSG
jgi:hypothetical protein